MSDLSQTRTFATPDEIAKIIADIEPGLKGKPIPHVLMAALALCFIIQNPAITPDQLLDGIDQTSQLIANIVATQLSGNGEEVDDIIVMAPGSDSIN